jgi:phosphoenolpyruvate synthase/pyruvate phosphate dikinase
MKNWVQWFLASIEIRDGAAVRRAPTVVPTGFLLARGAYQAFVARNRLKGSLRRALGDTAASAWSSAQARQGILGGQFPDELAREVLDAYHQLSSASCGSGAERALVTVRAAGEDDEELLLEVRGDEELLDAIRRCWAAQLQPRAIARRRAQGHTDADCSIGIQRVSRSEAGRVAGVAPRTRGRGQLLRLAA